VTLTFLIAATTANASATLLVTKPRMR